MALLGISVSQTAAPKPVDLNKTAAHRSQIVVRDLKHRFI
jgi:hypothetical protein